MFKGTMINPDEDQVKKIKAGLKQRHGYCPCAIDTTPDTKCPCKDYRMSGDCHCGLYVQVNK